MSRRKSGKKTKLNKKVPVKSRRQKKSQSQTPPSTSSECIINNNNNNPVVENLKQENHKVVVEQKDDGRTRFYGCYLLTSLSPRFKGHSYIGFTVNPRRRIRQHNGEITSGAFRTKKKRPWEMILCIHGFPSHASALQFEWAWQHPRESLAVREAAASFKTLGGLANKIKLALTMLTLHSWQSMNLTVSFFSTKYMNHAAGCPSLPHQMRLHFCSMDELPCYSDHNHAHDDEEDDFDSNDSGVSANYSDDRLEASADDSMETNLSSRHVQSCTVQHSSDNILAGDHIGTGGSWEFESSSVTGVPEEHMQPIHQLPVDVSGSVLNTSNELLWPGEEYWNEDVRGSFPDLEEHLQPTGSISTSENTMFPALKEKQPSCQLPADVPTSTWNDLYEQIRLRNEDGTEELRGSVHVIEEQIQPFQQVGPEREQSAMVGLVSVIEDAAKKDETTCIVIDDINEEQCQPTRVRSPLRSSNTHRAFSTDGIEVIELCTPSPDFRITTGSKKRRANSGFPDIIDLTRSPSFVQL